jgi:hypothetical protein
MLLGVAVAVYVGWLTRLGGPTMLDPDEHASALYFDRLVHGQQLEQVVFSTPKPLLTLVHGLGWMLFHDWHVGAALTVVAFAVAVVTFARMAGRVSGPVAAVLTVLLFLGWAEWSLQVARGNSVIWALACWGVAADALVARGRSPAASTPVPGSASDGSAGALSPVAAARAAAPPASAAAGPRWGIAAVALLLAGLARSETWLLLPVPVLFGLLAWRRGDRRGLLLLLALLAPALWLLHDELLSGSALFSVNTPSAYTDAYASGRRVIPPERWVRRFLRSYSHDRAAILITTSAAFGALFLLLRRRALGLVVTAGALFIGIWALLGRYAAEGVYISPRYFLLPNLALRSLAVFGLAVPLDLLLARLGTQRRVLWLGVAGLCVIVGALALSFLLGPLTPVDDAYRMARENGTRRSQIAAAAVQALRPVADEDGTVLLVPSLIRNRIAVELGLPLTRVRDDLLTVKVRKGQRFDQQLVQALHSVDAVVVDARDAGYAPLAVSVPTRFGADVIVPLRIDQSIGVYVVQVRHGKAEDAATTTTARDSTSPALDVVVPAPLASMAWRFGPDAGPEG